MQISALRVFARVRSRDEPKCSFNNMNIERNAIPNAPRKSKPNAINRIIVCNLYHRRYGKSISCHFDKDGREVDFSRINLSVKM